MTKQPEISCDRCILPGTCCKAFQLNHFFRAGTLPDDIMKWLRKNKLGMFRPLRRYHQWTGTFREDDGTNTKGVVIEQWQFSCTALQKNGRCGIYAKRPDLCKTYEPGEDLMCVHVRGVDGKPMIPQRKAR